MNNEHLATLTPDTEVVGTEGEEPCQNCKETVDPCRCMRNKCHHCGEPVGNITFACCDECWDKKHVKPADHPDLVSEAKEFYKAFTGMRHPPEGDLMAQAHILASFAQHKLQAQSAAIELKTILGKNGEIILVAKQGEYGDSTTHSISLEGLIQCAVMGGADIDRYQKALKSLSLELLERSIEK
jgi:hypothetical protein